MSFDVSGEPAHTRALTIALTQGEGATVNFRADILDLRKSGLMGLAGRVATAGIIHKMAVTGSFARGTLALTRIAWDQSHVMHEANHVTRGECCRDPMARLEGLLGTPVGEGFVGGLKQHFGGPLGCTHVNTLLQGLTASVQQHREEPGFAAERAPGEKISSRSVFFDAFFAEEGARISLGVRLTDACFGEVDSEGNETLDSHHEVGLVAGVDPAGWTLTHLKGRERTRRGPTFGVEPWTDRSDALGALQGKSLGGGMTRFCLDHFGSRPADARLLSALLVLAPGMTQVGVASSDSLVPSSSARPVGSPFGGPGPCYMLRAEGPLMASITGGATAGDD